MAEDKTRVDFNAPASLVERADTVAEVLDISRTRLLIDALQDELDELAADDGFRRRLSDAYYAGDVDFETVESTLGREEAMRMKLLRSSLDREPPEPRLKDELPPDEEFYDGEMPEWEPNPASDGDDSEPHA
jgi:predicted transcriptional regulator